MPLSSAVPGLGIGAEYAIAEDYMAEELAELFQERFFAEL
jgi:hypothetical protein